MKKPSFYLSISTLLLILLSCTPGIPEGATAVSPFDSKKYLGKWYEIARIDFKFEKNLNNTTAEYSMNDDGSIQVLNQGYNTKKDEWEQAKGTAKFVDSDSVARLKVSFFGPFYSGYNVIALDEDYRYALVAGESLDYLWILSRDTTIPQDVKEEYLQIAKTVGYDTDRLLWVEHTAQK
ncbi:lipocalin family protein [Algoriphagus aestuariicola]|jgi:apolipoprotein D and lipocalin family protein|uniref:Lipocalin family protein n=1 Tax=Algoriphagus aestuariicola TaxID=1852016 RepID=A0ABS3BY44_9BACT|nr:lipocalin family protein [Algoriphagus aestuariicola]MBN7803250.1 lipocalin family protein [Algoriphagus aestuariicola]